MVEVFKTNVEDQGHATMLVNQIQKVFIGYKANFDLEDCDKILRVKCASGPIDASGLVRICRDLGFYAEVLPDEPVSFESIGTMEERISNPYSKIPAIRRN